MAATNSVAVILPSLGLGVGIPVAFAPDMQVGARLTLDVHSSSLGFVSALDVFPSDGTAQVLLFGRVEP